MRLKLRGKRPRIVARPGVPPWLKASATAHREDAATALVDPDTVAVDTPAVAFLATGIRVLADQARSTGTHVHVAVAVTAIAATAIDRALTTTAAARPVVVPTAAGGTAAAPAATGIGKDAPAAAVDPDRVDVAIEAPGAIAHAVGPGLLAHQPRVTPGHRATPGLVVPTAAIDRAAPLRMRHRRHCAHGQCHRHHGQTTQYSTHTPLLVAPVMGARYRRNLQCPLNGMAGKRCRPISRSSPSRLWPLGRGREPLREPKPLR